MTRETSWTEYHSPPFKKPSLKDAQRGFIPCGIERTRTGIHYRYVEPSEDTKGIAVIAKAGQGKTTFIQFIFSMGLFLVGLLSGYRAIVQDPKRENARILRAMGVPYKNLNPFLYEFAAFDISSVVKNKAAIQRFVLTLMQKRELSELGEFWDQKVFELLSAIIESLVMMKHQGTIERWQLRDIICALQEIEYSPDDRIEGDSFKTLLRFCPTAQSLIQSINSKTGKSVVSSATGVMEVWSTIAARYSKATEYVTLEDWDKNVFLFGVGMEDEVVVNFLNRFIFEEIANYLRGLPERKKGDPERKVFNIIDEGLTILPLPQIDKLMEIGRSKDVSTVVTLLDIAGLQKKPEFGLEGTKAFLNLFRHFAVLGCTRNDAQFLVDNVFGYVEGTRYIPECEYVYEYAPVDPEDLNPPRFQDEREVLKKTRVVTGYRAEPFCEPRVPIESLVQIPPANRKNGMTGYFYSPNQYSEFSTYTAEDYEALFPYQDAIAEEDEECDRPIDPNDPYLCQIKPWSEEERKRLGI